MEKKKCKWKLAIVVKAGKQQISHGPLRWKAERITSLTMVALNCQLTLPLALMILVDHKPKMNAINTHTHTQWRETSLVTQSGLKLCHNSNQYAMKNKGKKTSIYIVFSLKCSRRRRPQGEVNEREKESEREGERFQFAVLAKRNAAFSAYFKHGFDFAWLLAGLGLRFWLWFRLGFGFFFCILTVCAWLRFWKLSLLWRSY